MTHTGQLSPRVQPFLFLPHKEAWKKKKKQQQQQQQHSGLQRGAML